MSAFRHLWRYPSARRASLLLVLLFAHRAPAETLTGQVTNGTTNQPGAGDEVILITLGQGMEESGRTKADAKGTFTLEVADAKVPHLIRVIHQGVTYHRMAPPGTTSVEVPVYDVLGKVTGVSVTADVMRFQAQDKELQGVRLFVVSNASAPPRTQMGEENFEFYLPPGAQVDQAMAMTANGQPVSSPPTQEKQSNRYAFNFPLRPGETQFQVVFRVPYNGQADIDLKPVYGSRHFVVMVPKSMQFTARGGASFKSIQDPRQADAVVEVASDTQPGDPLAFHIAGTGTLAEASDDQAEAPEAGATAPEAGSAPRDSRPGGGLGPPSDAPDPLEKYRWYILGLFAVVLAGGGIYIARRSRTAVPAEVGRPEHAADAKRSGQPARGAMLLEALKEELFQLEVEHKQQRISQSEYEKAKAALDQTLARALRRESVPSR
jgi:hypothetical protein